MHKFLFYSKFIICLYMFRALCAHHQNVKIVLYSIWCHHTCRWPSGAQVERRLLLPLSNCAQDGHLYVWWYQMLYNTILTSWWWAHSAQVERGLSRPVHRMATYRRDDTRWCVIQFWPPDDELIVHSLREDSLKLCTGWPPTGVMILDAV